MDSLNELVEAVIGVDTQRGHAHGSRRQRGTSAAMAELTVEATAAGYAELVAFADEHSGLRAWAIEGTGIHGAGLTRHLQQAGEVVIELDRPERAQRRNGAKSDALDAVRAAREALSRTRLGTPRAAGDRQALSVLLTARRSAVESSTTRNGRSSASSMNRPEFRGGSRSTEDEIRGSTTEVPAGVAGPGDAAGGRGPEGGPGA